MAKQTRREIYITCNGKSADDMLRTLTNHAAQLDAQIKKLIADGKGNTKECKELVSVSGQLHKQLKQNISNTQMIDKVMRNLAGSTTAQLRKALQAVNREISRSSESSGKLPQLRKQMEALKAQIDKNTGAIHKQGGAWNSALKNLTAYVGLFSLFNKAKDLVTGAIKKNLEYSGSLTDIRKVSGLTMDQVKQLSTELAKIDTRTSVDGLAKLAYEASKLGVGKYGVEGMAQFVRAADKINVAIGEEMGEKALPSLLKMTEVMGLIPRMGLEKSIEAVGSAMFKLSSTSTATSNDITEFAKRCTGVARTAGITTDQLLALGSAFSAQMASPEVAATAMSKFIVALQKNHNLIEKDLAIPAGTINDMYKAGHAMDAIVLILEKMKEKGNMNALGEIFKDVGGEGQRLISSMVTMAKNVDMLKDHLYESQEAFEEATAVGKEYAMQQMSAIGILERANNLWEKAFVNPDGVDAVKGMAEWWYEMSKTMTSSPLLKGTLQVALQMVLWALKGVATLLPVIIGYIASQGLYSGLRLLYQYVAALGMAGKALFRYVRVLFTANAAQSTLNKTMKLNPWIALASVIVGVAGAIYGYTQRAKEAAEAEKEAQRQANAWRKTLGQAAVETSDLNKKLANYKRMMNEANLSQKDRQRLISRFNRDFRSYISKLGIEIKSVKDLRDHYSELAQEAQRATYYRMREQAKQQALPKLDAGRNAASNALMAHVEKLGLTKLGVTFQDIDRWVSAGLGGDALFWKLAKTMPESKSGLLKGANWKLDKKGFVYRESYDKSKAGLTDSQMQYDLRDLLSASRWYVNATRRRSNKEIEINKAYKNFVPEGYTPYSEEEPGTLENKAQGKNATTGSGGNPNHDEKNIAKDRANALIANIKAFYEEQMRKYLEWVAQMNADGEKISEGQQKEQLDYLQSQMDRALGTARQSITNLGDGWKQFYSHMDEDVMVFDDETSKQLLESIGKADVGELHELFTKLSGDLSRENNKTLAENLGALLDQIFANGSKELREAAEKLLARQREIQKILNEHDYTGAVNRNTRSNFDRLGFLQPAENIRTDSPEGLEKMNTAFDKLTTKARESITVLYSLNPESEDFQNQFLQFLSVANEGFDFSKLSAQNLKALYLELIKYSGEYTAAEKKNADERKKNNDFLWNRQGRQADQDNRRRAMQQVGNGIERFRKAGKGEDSNAPRSGEMGGSKFMEDFSYNANIEQSKLEITLIQEKIAWLQKLNATSEQVAELQKSLAEKQDSYILALMQTMKQRAEAVYALYKPLEEFGTAAGQAFATMTEDAEAGRDAFKAAIGDMINSMMKQTVQMTQEYVKRRLMQKVNDKLVSTQIKKSTKEQVALEQGGADATSAITKAAGDAKVLLTENVGQQVVNAVTTQTQTTTSIAQSAAATDVSTQSTKTEANVGLGIAEGSAKTIGSLGWWGIPLIAVITAVLNGLLDFAMGKVSSLFGKGKDNNNNNNKNTKVVSGMLTYDSGNVQDLRPFVGNDGSLYWATEDSKPHDGVSLLTQPTATTINGQPSLVAENGPELVIGRETTQAMMMNNPQLLKALVNYDRNYSGRRAYDNGNIAESSATIAPQPSVTDEMVSVQANTNIALLQAVNTLLQRLEQPIEAKIDMYGRGKLYDSMTKANQFMKGK